jgi:hypothetical protein
MGELMASAKKSTSMKLAATIREVGGNHLGGRKSHNSIFRDAEKNPYTQTSVHAEIERNLISAYLCHINKLDA